MKKKVYAKYGEGIYAHDAFGSFMNALDGELALDVPLPGHLFRVYHVGAPYSITLVFSEFKGDFWDPHPQTSLTLVGERDAINLLEERLLEGWKKPEPAPLRGVNVDVD